VVSVQLVITVDESAKLAEVRRLLGEVNAGLKERGAPVCLCIATGRGGLLCDADGKLLVIGATAAP
jgi:hypothetical protein